MEILCYHFQCPLVLKIILLFVILYGADLSDKQRTLSLYYQKISIFFIEKWYAVIDKTRIKYKNLLELSCVVWKFGIPLFKQADEAPLLFFAVRRYMVTLVERFWLNSAETRLLSGSYPAMTRQSPNSESPLEV